MSNRFPVWANYHVIRSKYKIGSRAIPEIILFIIMLFMWLAGLIPTFPQRPLDYGFIYHAPHIGSWIISLGLSGSKSIELFYLGYIIRGITFIADGFALIFSIIELVQCYTGVLPMECRDTQFADITFTIFSLVLFLLSLVTIWHIMNVMRRVRLATTIHKLKRI